MRIASIIALMVMALSSQAGADELARLDLDDASTIGLRIETDSNEKIEGKGSLRITTLWPTTVCLGEVTDLHFEGAKLIFTATVKSDLQGEAYLEMWAHVSGGQYFSRGLKSTVKGKEDWTTIQTPFMFQRGQKPDKVTLNIIINGKGTVWVDDLVLSKEQLN